MDEFYYEKKILTNTKVGSMILLTLIILISIPYFIPAKAQEQTQIINQVGKDFSNQEYILSNGTIIGRWSSHPDYILDNGQYKSFKVTEDAINILIESEQGSILYNKIACSAQIYNINSVSGKPIIPSVSYTVKGTLALQNNYQPIALNNEPCQTTLLLKGNDMEIKGTKHIDNIGTFTVRWIKQEGHLLKTQLEATNLNPAWTNHKVGFTETIHVPRIIKLGEVSYDLASLNGTVLDRSWVINNKASLLALTDKLNYDFGLGFQFFRQLTILWDGTEAKLAIDYTNMDLILPVGQTVIVDPQFSASPSSDRSVRTNAAAGATCPTASYGYAVDSGVNVERDGVGRLCYINVLQFDLSTLPNAITVTNSTYKWSSQPTISSARNCNINDLEDDITVETAENSWNDAHNGTQYISNNAACASSQSAYQFDLGASADLAIATQVTTTDRFGIGIVFNDESRDGIDHFHLFQDKTLIVDYIENQQSINVRAMLFDNSTAITSGTVFHTNLTKSDSKSINSTGFTDAFTGLASTQNFTIKEGTDNFVTLRDWNFISDYNGTRQYATNIKDVSCPRNGAGNDFRIMVNDTMVSRMTMTTPSCDSNSDIALSVTFNRDGVNATSANSTMLVTILNTTEYGKNFDLFTINGTVNATTYTTPKVNSTTNWSAANGLSTRTFNLLIQTSTTQLPKTPILTAQGFNQTAIQLTWTDATNGTAPIIGYQIQRNSTIIVNDTGTTTITYIDAGLVTGNYQRYIVAGWNEGGMGYFSNMVNETTQETTTGNHLVNSTVVANIFGITSRLEIITGQPIPNVTKLDLYNYTNLLETKTMNHQVPKGLTTYVTGGTFYKVINSLSNFTVQATVTNTTGNVILTSAPVFAQPNYIPTDVENNGILFNYTYQRLSNNSVLQLNATITPILFNMQCRYQDELFGTPTWINVTNVGYYFNNLGVNPTRTVVVSCYTNPFLFTFSSGGGVNGTLTLLNYVNTLGNLFGVPIPFFFVILFASLWTGRSAPTGIIALAITIGIMGVMGYFNDPDTGQPLINGTMWGIVVLITILGLFIGKRYL